MGVCCAIAGAGLIAMKTKKTMMQSTPIKIRYPIDFIVCSPSKLVRNAPTPLQRQHWRSYRVPEIVTRGRFPDGGESDSTWRTQEARHVGSDTIAPGF